MEFLGKKFIGVEAFCMERKAMRQFRVDRILAME
jgi:predicted DNA-binding transcriptional regulator YafY